MNSLTFTIVCLVVTVAVDATVIVVVDATGMIAGIAAVIEIAVAIAAETTVVVAAIGMIEIAVVQHKLHMAVMSVVIATIAAIAAVNALHVSPVLIAKTVQRVKHSHVQVVNKTLLKVKFWFVTVRPASGPTITTGCPRWARSRRGCWAAGPGTVDSTSVRSPWAPPAATARAPNSA